MKYDKKTITAAAIAGVVGLGSVSAAVSAHDKSSDAEHPPIVKKLADKFNLDEDKVNQVFTENRKEHKAQRQQQLEERLTQAVTEGKITEDQKTQLLAKIGEMKAAFIGSADDKKQFIADHRSELKSWAEENNINLQELKLKKDFGPRHLQ